MYGEDSSRGGGEGTGEAHPAQQLCAWSREQGQLPLCSSCSRSSDALTRREPGTGRMRCTCRPAPPTVPPRVRGRPDSSREMRGKEEVFMGRCSEAKEGRHPGHLQSQRASSGRVGAWQRTPGGLLGGRWGYTDDSHQAPGPCFFLTFFFAFILEAEKAGEEACGWPGPPPLRLLLSPKLKG